VYEKFDSMKQIPNLFTLLNLLFGCLAIVCLLTDGMVLVPTAEGNVYFDLPASIGLASLFIALAAVVDFFDGMLARLLNADSNLGRELDSLADVVSFGVAPGMILFSFLRLSWSAEVSALNTSIQYLIPAFLIPLAAAWRLARFNINPAQPNYFEGVPTPAVGLTIATLPLAYWMENGSWLSELLLESWFLYALTLILSALMVVRWPMMSFKFQNFSWEKNSPRYLFLLVAVGAGFFLSWSAALPVFGVYVLLSLLFQNRIR
jgi:CDP-diacylglycerol--serine O-phosphatidyltransferase